jgi:hypothetical protein
MENNLVVNEAIVKVAIENAIHDLETFAEFLPFGGLFIANEGVKIINPELKEGEEPGEQTLKKLSKKLKNEMFVQSAIAFFTCYMAEDDTAEASEKQMIVIEITHKVKSPQYFYYFNYSIQEMKVTITDSYAESVI